MTRLWHWVLVVTVGLGWYFGNYMTFTTIEWHFYCGYTLLTLLIFRVFWGLFGPKTARLRGLFFSPRATFAYLRQVGTRQPSGTPGHNPLGALSVVAMLALLTAQGLSGLFIESEDFFEAAPLAHLVSDAVTDRLTWWHHLLAKILAALIGLHVLAILYYMLWKKENLVEAMITGWKWVRSKPE